jgi:DNA-binding ferritin-like protein (Dps family)
MASFYKATAEQLHKDFISNLNELTNTDSQFWRREIIKELQDLQSLAKQLLEMNVLHELDAGRLKHITGRDLKQFIYFARHKESTKHDPTDNAALLKRHGIPTRDPF